MTAVNQELQFHAYRAALIAAVALVIAIVSVGPAGAVSQQVRSACAGDYLSNCSAYQPDSAQTRRCMRAVGYKLSKGCIAALVAGGEVSKAEIARRQASNRR
ncbi:MAG: hypothetical protein WDN31_14570 [Hyphomicrobium sp.]